MRRRSVAQAAKFIRFSARRVLLEVRKFAGEAIDLMLLAHDDRIQTFKQVFGEAGLDLEIGQAVIDCG